MPKIESKQSSCDTLKKINQLLKVLLAHFAMWPIRLRPGQVRISATLRFLA